MSALRPLNLPEYVSNHLYNNHLNKSELKACLGERGSQPAPGSLLQTGKKKTPNSCTKNAILWGVFLTLHHSRPPGMGLGCPRAVRVLLSAKHCSTAKAFCKNKRRGRVGNVYFPRAGHSSSDTALLQRVPLCLYGMINETQIVCSPDGCCSHQVRTWE